MRRLFFVGYTCALVVGLWLLVTALVPQAASLSSTIWPVIIYNTWPAGLALGSNTTLDTTIHPVVCVDPLTHAPIACIPTAGPTYTPAPSTPTPQPTVYTILGADVNSAGQVTNPVERAPISQANGGTGTTSLNAANIAQTVNTQAGNPLSTISGFTYGVENTLWTLTLPANTLGPYDVMQCRYEGTVQNNTGGTILYSDLFHIGSKSLTTAVSYSTLINRRFFTFDTFIANDGAQNLNSDNAFLNFGASGPANGAAIAGASGGALTLANTGLSGYEQSAVDFAAQQTISMGAIVGAATPAATPTASPTAATTPLVQLYSGRCWKLPGTTPTPTRTPTPTPTATP